jgi:hypothetical protein
VQQVHDRSCSGVIGVLIQPRPRATGRKDLTRMILADEGKTASYQPYWVTSPRRQGLVERGAGNAGGFGLSDGQYAAEPPSSC